MAGKKDGLAQELKRTLYLTVAVLVGWTFIIVLNLYWEIQRESQGALELAEIEVRSSFNKDVGLRLWATSHGGVYVPTDERTPPNPYLAHVPERDISTPSGKKLTLINPAYMLRQFMDEYSELYAVKGKITSLKLLNPDNAPDAWEQVALQAFTVGEHERLELSLIEGEQYLRLMQPLLVTAGCLKCHGHQGYKEGDVRGGLSVAVPMAPYLAIKQQNAQVLLLSHGSVWLLVVIGILMATRWRRKRLRTFLHMQDTLATSEERLGQEMQRLDEIIWGTNVGTWEWDVQSGETHFNERWAEIVGYSLDELRPLSIETWQNLTHPEDLKISGEILEKHFSHELDYYECEVRMQHKDSDWVWVITRGKVVAWDEDGKPLRMSGTHTDITKRKKAEIVLQQQALVFENIYDGMIITDSEGKIVEWSPSAARMFGYSAKDVLGQSPALLLRTEDAERLTKEVIRGVLEENRWQGELDFVRQDGAEGVCETVFAPIMDDQGSLVAAVGVNHDITERKRLETELLQQKVLLESMFQAIPDALIITDAERRIAKCNPGVGQIFGFKSEQLLGKNPRFLYASNEDLVSQGQERLKLSAGEMLAPHIANYRRENGETFPGETVGTVIKDSAGKILGYLDLTRDVSKRLRSEQEVRDRAELYRALFESNHSIMLLFDPIDGAIVDANPVACSFYGYHRAEMRKKTVFDINTLPINDMRQKLSLTKEAGQKFFFQHRVGSGELRDVEVHSGVINIHGRELICSIIYDITLRKQAEEALLISEKKHKYLAEVSPSGIWQADIKGKLTYVSPRWSEITGMTAGDAVGFGWQKGLHPEDRERIYKQWSVVATHQAGHYRSEYRYLRPDGSLVWVLCVASTQKDEQGLTLSWVGTITDITDLKQQEETLRENEKSLSASLQEKEVLLREIHHRVKNNLQIISSLLQLQARQGSLEVVSALNESERRVKVMAHLHEKLYQSGDLQQVDTHEFLCSLIYDLKASQLNSHQPITIYQDIEQIELNLDQAILVGQIFSELLSNAFKHAFPDEQSGGEIRITLHKTVEGQIELSMADNGVGLPEAFNYDKTKSLGWQLVQALSNKLGAKIELERTNGTRIRLLFDEAQV